MFEARPSTPRSDEAEVVRAQAVLGDAEKRDGVKAVLTYYDAGADLRRAVHHSGERIQTRTGLEADDVVGGAGGGEVRDDVLPERAGEGERVGAGPADGAGPVDGGGR